MQYSPQWLLSTERLRVQTCSKNLGLLFYVFFTSISEADGDNDRSGVLFLTVIFVAGLLKNLYDVAMLLEYGESRVDGGPYKGNESTADTPLFIRFFFLTHCACIWRFIFENRIMPFLQRSLLRLNLTLVCVEQNGFRSGENYTDIAWRDDTAMCPPSEVVWCPKEEVRV